MLISFLLVSTTGYAQFVNGNSQTYSVQHLRDNAMRYSFIDKNVVLQGYIVEHIREDYFLFKDDTGTIRLEIYPSRMPSTPFTSNTRVMVTGEVGLFFLRPEIFVSSVRIMGQDDDKTTPIAIPEVSSRYRYHDDYY